MSASSSRASSSAEDESVTEPAAILEEESDADAATISFNDLKRGAKLSQTSISLEAFILGLTTGSGLCFTIYFALISPSPIWRTPLFLSVLCLFHFCEFYTYARWNLKNMNKNSFLTLSNGSAYIGAMSFGLVETVVTSLFFRTWQSIWSQWWIQIVGLVLLATGQFARHYSIATAGVSFNHHVQSKKRSDHVLVTWGPYAWIRHPSYFGFYWWAVGSQILVGNALSTLIFTGVLWRFFFHRITVEEKYLLKMFGGEYERFRTNTPIGIPFMSTSVNAALQRLNTPRRQT